MMCFSRGPIGCCGYNIRHYLPDGRTAWIKRWDGPPESQGAYRKFYTGTPLHADARADGSIAVVGTRGRKEVDLRVYAADGSEIWTRDVRTDARPSTNDSFEYFIAMAVGCTETRVGVLWVVYRDGFGPLYGSAIYTADGELVSIAEIGAFVSGTTIMPFGALDGSGNMWVPTKRGAFPGAIAVSIDGAAIPNGLSFNAEGDVIDIETDMLANDIDVDDEGAEWWIGTAFMSRFTLGTPSTLEWQLHRTTDQASRLSTGEILGAGRPGYNDGTSARPLRLFDWADGALGATWPTNGPTTATWNGTVHRVRAMRPVPGAIASLGGNSFGHCNIMRLDEVGAMIWRNKHTAAGFRNFAPHADGAVTGITLDIERTTMDKSLVDFDEL